MRSRTSHRHPEVRAKRASKGDGPGRSSTDLGFTRDRHISAQDGALAPQDDGKRLRQRIDKWLWHARIVRTRSDAAALADAGYVRLNGKRIAACSQPVRVGDVVTLALDRSVRVLKVEGFCERRGAALAARTLYRDLTTNSGAKASIAARDSAKVSPPKTHAE